MGNNLAIFILTYLILFYSIKYPALPQRQPYPKRAIALLRKPRNMPGVLKLGQFFQPRGAPYNAAIGQP